MRSLYARNILQLSQSAERSSDIAKKKMIFNFVKDESRSPPQPVAEAFSSSEAFLPQLRAGWRSIRRWAGCTIQHLTSLLSYSQLGARSQS